MIGNIKRTFPPKTGMREKQLLQDPGYVRGVEGPCGMLHGILQGCTNTMSKVSKRNKIIINEYLRLHLRLLFVMSEVSKGLYTYMNRMRPLPQYVHTDTAVASSPSNSK